MGVGVGLAAGIMQAGMTYKSAFDKYEAEQSQANLMAGARGRMETMLTKNLQAADVQHGAEQAGIRRGFENVSRVLTARLERKIGEITVRGGESGVKLGTGTLDTQRRAQEEEGAQGLANIRGQAKTQSTQLTARYKAGTAVMKANVKEQQDKLEAEERALRTASASARGGIEMKSLFAGVMTGATIGNLGTGKAGSLSGSDWGAWKKLWKPKSMS